MIFIPHNVPSSKNSKVKAKHGVFNSPAVRKYLQKLGVKKYNSSKKTVENYVTRPNLFMAYKSEFAKMMEGKEPPVFIGYHHVRDTRRKFDFSNSVEILQDLMTAHGFIEDDNVSFVFPVPMTKEGELPAENNLRKEDWYSVDKHRPGVYIKIF